MPPTHPGTPPTPYNAGSWQAQPDSPVYTGETSGLPHSISAWSTPLAALRPASLRVAAYSGPHLLPLMALRSRLWTKGEAGAQKAKVTQARSQSKEVAGWGFRPSPGSRKAWRTLGCPLPSPPPPPASGSPSSRPFQCLCKGPLPHPVLEVNNFHLTTAVTPYLQAPTAAGTTTPGHRSYFRSVSLGGRL